ncbi:MAG: hypothetical protein CW691_00020 [Candidatus Bathyarchaeum sp.]|nr:MAG: hypothetical protein CW691_00020 [Candidatus Bathyarchaeum sp.]
MSVSENRVIWRYEWVGMVFIMLLGGLLHFTFEMSGFNPVVGAFSAVNESVWEHLKLGFWPAVLYAAIEYRQIRKQTNNFFVAKTVVPYTVIVVVTAIFYSYTSITGESIFLIDITSFFVAVIMGQYLSYRLLIRDKLADWTEKLALALCVMLGILFVVFTFYPPELSPFQDPSGDYGIIEHAH